MSDITHSRRGRPPRISRDRVIEAAIDLGLGEFSMDAVAARLGVTTPALYTHVEGRDDIVRGAAAAIIGRAGPDPDPADDWRHWIRSWAMRLRDELGSVGGEILDAIGGGLDVAHVDAAERGIALLLDAGLTPAEAGHTLWLAARIAVSVGPSGSSSVGRVVEVARQSAAVEPQAAMVEAMDAVREVDNDEAFAFDLDVLIGGVEARLVA